MPQNSLQTYSLKIHKGPPKTLEQPGPTQIDHLTYKHDNQQPIQAQWLNPVSKSKLLSFGTNYRLKSRIAHLKINLKIDLKNTT